MTKVIVKEVKGKRGLYTIEQKIKTPLELILYANSTINPNIKKGISSNTIINYLKESKGLKEHGFRESRSCRSKKSLSYKILKGKQKKRKVTGTVKPKSGHRFKTS